MAYEAIIKEAKDLSEQKQGEVLDFILFLKTKNNKEQDATASKGKRKLNALAGKLLYMADDFDDTLDCFKEYM